MGLFSIICCQKNEGYKLSLVVRKNLLQNLNCYVLFYYLPRQNWYRSDKTESATSLDTMGT